MSVNRAVITGFLARDPELKATQSGTSILHFTVGVNDRVQNKQTNEWEDRPNWIDCVCFGSRAEGLSRYLHKGSKVAIEGKLRWSSWETQDGSKRSKVEITVDTLDFMSGGNGSGSNQTVSQPAQQPANVAVADEDIPF